MIRAKKSSVSFIFVLIIASVWVHIHTERNTAKASARGETAQYELASIQNGQAEQYIEHTGYTVSYNTDWRIPNWVAYQLTRNEVQGEVERFDRFLPDPAISYNPVVTKDYSHSGYDRGHMAPAADMKWSEQAMKESFYMTNICPQNHSNNAGDWKDLEEMVRDLAMEYDSIYIVCGPIVTSTDMTIGSERRIVVPQGFYKALLRYTGHHWTAIAFKMPNAAGNKPLMTHIHSVDEIEQEIGIDLFHLLPDSIEQSVEADYHISDWTVTR